MKRIITSKSGKESYGSKWQSIESSSDDKSAQDNEDRIHEHVLGSNETAQVPTIGAEELQSPTIPQAIGNNSRRISADGETMYRAAIQGDCLAAEILLSRNPNLATDFLTAEGDRALHVAAAMKRGKFVRKLVSWMKEEDDLLLRDGHGCTACCFAAISGVKQIASVMIENKPDVVTAYDGNNLTPIHKAALSGNKGMLSYLLKSSKVEDLSNDAWFDILLLTIKEKMFDVAIELVEKNHDLARMAKDERTALHLLAQLDTSNVSELRVNPLAIIFSVNLTELSGKRPSNFVKLGEKLWTEMQKMEQTSLLEVIRKRHLLHDAAKAGHAELLTMLIRSYPQLVLDTDSDGYTIFHIAVSCRQHAVFSLINQVKAMMHTRIISRDKDGNNILHLAAMLSLNRSTKSTPATLLQRELRWFNMTKTVVPPSYQDMRNNDGLTPKGLFSKMHKRMLNDSKTWMMNSADSYMLIATILISVVFAAAFALPGGYDPQTGKPILIARKPFKDFLATEVYGLTASVISILIFRSILTSAFAEDDFLVLLPLKMLLGFNSMLLSLMYAIAAFLSSFQLAGRKLNHGDMLNSVVILYIACVLWLLRELAKTFSWDIYMLRKSTLFDSFPPASIT